ncbi:RusA family crossover junction endodeoxyribonuclease [Polynucleobacter sp.]|uniref:RusA family crossover junction endodeoxyribonuclease n=1 Tax=Polynucleobacter sp. TaxID=2029855 RepID=UPI003F69FA36
MLFELYLPFPPTVNDYYTKTARGVYISTKGRIFRELVSEAVNEQLPGVHIDVPMLLEVVLYMPDARRRDIDNYQKALLDSLTICGLWADDSLVNQLYIFRGKATARSGGSVFMRILDGGPVLPAGTLP